MPIDRKDGGRGPEQVWHAGRPPGGDGDEGGGEGLGQVSLRSPGGRGLGGICIKGQEGCSEPGSLRACWQVLACALPPPGAPSGSTLS